MYTQKKEVTMSAKQSPKTTVTPKVSTKISPKVFTPQVFTNDSARPPAQLTKDAKAVIQRAFEDLGGVERLVEWANNPANLGSFYTQIWSKIIPRDVKTEVTGKDGKAIQLELLQNINVRLLSDDELSKLVELTQKCTEDGSTEYSAD